MEELIKLALLLLTVFFYLYKALKKKPDEDILPIPGLPDEVRKGSRHSRPASSQEDELNDLSEESLQVRREKKKKPNEIIRRQSRAVLQPIVAEADVEESDSMAAFDALEEQYSAEQQMIIYSEIMKRPEF